MELRSLTTEDLRFVFETRRHPGVDSYLLGDPPNDFDTHCAYIEGSNKEFFILFDDDTPLGYSQVSPVACDTLEVGFAIHPDHQRKGYGAFLVKETVRAFSKNHHIILYVKADNLRAYRLYQKLGFLEISCRRGICLMGYSRSS